MVFVTVLVKREQNIGFITGAQHFAGTDADLENGRTAGNRRRDRHERHDFLLAAPASRARNPPMAWMPSCELPAMRMTAS